VRWPFSFASPPPKAYVCIEHNFSTFDSRAASRHIEAHLVDSVFEILGMSVKMYLKVL